MKTLILILSLIVFNAYASGDRVGNGGDVVKCKDSVEILDLHESPEPLKKMTASGHNELVAEVLENLKRLNPEQSRQYSARVKTFYDSVEFKAGISLVDVKDSKHVYLPKSHDCRLVQIAIRRNNASKMTKQFIIDQDLWKGLSDRSKAGLVLHEIIYEHFFKLGEDDSSKARILNAYLFSERAFSDSPKEYWDLIKSLKVPIYK